MEAPQNSEDRNSWERLSVEERFRTSLGGMSTTGHRGVSVLRPFRTRLIVTDSVLVALALGVGLLLSSRASAWAIDPTLAIYGTPVVIAALWLAMLGLRGSYDQRVIGLGTEEIRRVVSATLYTFAIVAGLSYLVRADISRAYAFVSLPVGLVIAIGGRFAWRSWLYRRREKNEFQHATLVVGSGAAAEELIDRLSRDSFAGYAFVGRFFAPPSEIELVPSWLQGLVAAVDDSSATAVAVAPSATMTSSIIRDIAWQVEGRNLDLLIAPAIMDISGPRLSVRPAAGLPLLHLDEVSLSRPQRFSKRTLDLTLTTIALLLLGPVMLLVALVVKLTSSGPVIFKQTRIGRSGQAFTMLKFRTMSEGAEHLKASLRSQYELDQPMFKIIDDPRITTVGRFLRRWSIDELPQLFNVLGGSMSLVGPRPHPMDDVDRYELMAYRRLALKPGLTGLWQVEGRSNLPWDEALQMDLYYVESWSLSNDLVLLARTIRVVLAGRGAA